MATTLSDTEGARVKELSQFAADNSYSLLPEDIVGRTKLAIMNMIAVSIGASSYPDGKTLLSTCMKIQNGNVPIFGSGKSAGPIAATWANSALAHYLDFDDTYLLTVVHPSTPIIPAVMSLGIDNGSSGKDAIYSTAIGMEALIRLSRSIGLDETYSKWHNTSLYGTPSSALASAMIMGGNADEINSAILQGMTIATGFLSSKGTLTKSFQVGRSAAEGAISALAAKEGVTTSPKILSSFAVSLSQKLEMGHLTEKLGKEWNVTKNFLKPYPCCVAIHPMIDAAIEIRKQGVQPSEIEKVHAYTSPFTAGAECIQEPKSGLESKFSPNHALASSLLHGRLYPVNFTDEAVKDGITSVLRGKIEVSSREGINMGQTILEVTLKDGRKVSSEINRGGDTPSKVLDHSDVKEKFHHLVDPVMGEDQSKQIWEFLDNLESRDNISEIKELF